jgi:hypothetical protein
LPSGSVAVHLPRKDIGSGIELGLDPSFGRVLIKPVVLPPGVKVQERCRVGVADAKGDGIGTNIEQVSIRMVVLCPRQVDPLRAFGKDVVEYFIAPTKADVTADDTTWLINVEAYREALKLAEEVVGNDGLLTRVAVNAYTTLDLAGRRTSGRADIPDYVVIHHVHGVVAFQQNGPQKTFDIHEDVAGDATVLVVDIQPEAASVLQVAEDIPADQGAGARVELETGTLPDSFNIQRADALDYVVLYQ